eukprot:TRINITY_DN7657_c0_g1_i2.p1 TRINITY_DN7657_c0_g1~~TRINITY_DN7657_c0_g1_i2.p1  ORF type:complete len:197 (+),score=56.33 TRINITY_DN7657_c0_g1_i2:90-680(+)
MIRRPPRSTLSSSSAASDVYKRQVSTQSTGDTRLRAMSKNLWVAAADGELETIEQLISDGKHGVNDQDDSGYSALHAAASYGHAVLLCWLVNEGGDVTLADEDGDTPMHSCESVECADVLLEAGADLGCTNHRGWTACDVAVDDGERGEMVEWYKEHGLEPSVEAEEAEPEVADITHLEPLEGEEAEDSISGSPAA